MSTDGSDKQRLRCPRCGCVPVLSQREGRWWCGCFCCEPHCVEPGVSRLDMPDLAVDKWNANVERLRGAAP